MNVQDIEIERAVIGEILTFDDLKEKVSLLEVEDFYYNEHKIICKAMINQNNSANSFDFITIANECGSEYRAEIQNCIQLAISAQLFEEHFKLLKEMASKRRLITQFNSLAMDGDISVSSLQKMIDDESIKKLTSSIEKSNEKNIEEFIAGLNKHKGALMTGFGTIDKVIGGIRKSTVFIVGARPSTGKTSFALNIAANQINFDKKVMFFSLEMSSEMIFERLISARNNIEYEKFSRNNLTDEEIDMITMQSQKLKEDGKFFVVDDIYNVEQICNLITENKPDLAVIDFMQIISAMGKFENVRNRIDYISSLFKRTAKSTGCVIIVLSQLSRIGKDAPTMSDLKESGGLEQDGDYIALLHRPYVLNKNDENVRPEDTELLLDKNKFGRTGKIDLWFDLKHQRFTEYDTRWDCAGNPFEDDIGL